MMDYVLLNLSGIVSHSINTETAKKKVGQLEKRDETI